MADFRKCIPVFAVLALILGLTATASAQNAAFSCTATVATPYQLRSEGLTELVGDVLITCTGGTPTADMANIPLVNISVFIGNTTVTSRLLSTTTGQSEALLLLDDPSAAAGAANPQTLAYAHTAIGNGTGGFVPGGTGAISPGYYGAGANANIFPGTIIAAQPNAVSWAGIPIDPPGTNGTRVIRITNIRINANALGVGTPTSPPVQVFAFISVAPSTTLPITNNAQQVVGLVQRSLDTSVDAVTYQQCLSPGIDVTPVVTFAELATFPNAFKPRISTTMLQDVPGGSYFSESGFVSAATGVAGLADFGTRLKAVFTNIPAGVTLSVPSSVSVFDAGGNLTFQAVMVASETSASAFPGVVVTPVAGSVVYGAATALTVASSNTIVYEVTASNPQGIDTLTVPVSVDYTPNPSASPGLGTATVNASYAPTPPAFDATNGRFAQPATYPIPRFVDTSTAGDLVTINVCATNLLFPFVTNQVGFDTGLAIANTTEDAPVYDTTPQEGTCTLYSYGDNAPSAVESPSVAAGTVWTTLASISMPDFQGYVIAHCTFQYAHGFAFISDLGARNLAMGYLALVIPDAGMRIPGPTGFNTNEGEQLAQ